jgi:hypothetical protein
MNLSGTLDRDPKVQERWRGAHRDSINAGDGAALDSTTAAMQGSTVEMECTTRSGGVR